MWGNTWLIYGTHCGRSPFPGTGLWVGLLLSLSAFTRLRWVLKPEILPHRLVNTCHFESSPLPSS